jgi:glycosyltransferase involved in cell wall biosynthesis
MLDSSSISVIIRNHNEHEYIGFSIQSVLDFIPNAEILVIDDNSTDDSLDVVKLFNNRANIKVVSIEDYTPGKALNFGVQKSKHQTILILSAHSQITSLDLQYVNQKLQTYVAVFGKQTPIYRGKKISKRYIWSHFLDVEQENMYSTLESRPFLHNAFCFYRKDILLEYPFDETLPGKEDRYWADSILNINKSYLYTPTIEVNHYYTTNGATWKGIG